MGLLSLGLIAILGVDVPPVGLDLIPQPPQIPMGLPSAVESQDGSGTWLPTPLDTAIKDMLRYCVDDYPGICGIAMGEQARIERTVCEGRVKVLQAQHLASRVAQPEPDPWWQPWVIGVSAFVVGAASGVVVYSLAR